MSTYQRFFLGGVGGLAPVLMFLVTVDWQHFVAGATALKIFGYCVRVIVLFGVGGFVAYLHSDEQTPFKLFEVGLGAPALIAGYLTTSLVPAQIAGNSQKNEFSIITVVHAQTAPTPQGPKKFTLPPQSPSAQFLQGLIGRTPKNVWFVIAGSFPKLEDATSQADSINRKYRDFKAEVYAPYSDYPNYSVVIGANLTQADAKTLREKAVSEGLPKDTYYKTFPSLPPPE